MNINPITRMDYPDPDIIRVDDTYYMVSTTMHFFPGGAILRSYNLIDWEIVTYVFDKLDDTPGERLERELVNYGAGMWAPSFKYHSGTFYVMFNSHTGGAKTYLFKANSIEGPWEVTVLDEVFYDCALFFDDDEKSYVLHGNGTIRITELNEALTGPKQGGLDRVLYEDDCEGLHYEGTHILKKDGYYYIFNINWPSGDIRTQWCHRAKKLTDDFECKQIFHNYYDFEGHGVAQGSVIDDVDGNWYCYLFEDAGAVGRIPVIMPMKWENGWPVVGINGSVPNEFNYPQTTKKLSSNLYTSDNFEYMVGSNGKMSVKKQWQWNHRPVDSLWYYVQGGGLGISTGKLAINVTHANNCLTQRMLFPKCAAKVTIDATGLNNGDVAGLCGLQSAYGYVGIEKNAGNYYVVNRVKNVDDVVSSKCTGDCMPGELIEEVAIEGPVITLAISAEFGKKEELLHFYYVDEATKQLVEIGKPHKMVYRLDHFTGYRFGLFVYSTKSVGGSAIFKKFEYITDTLNE